ncbi:uncharacterized protein OCT59_013154 [Rhizophagus irregularis]|uniref:Kelch-like protein 17 n=2 Tax=Rhizophagus irregularis TaxID=588596 RepID=A0A015J1G1_RHIIW|nr:hypothetical protein GLOIN_2v1573165 [Rhizophagus irregularis DAOM 181602=DAOM 197198]EXX60550.1 hypothetical protein RirG_178820 [Rhizophagus irregularis DAOM 197198w]POG74784.1 hypothetical protein GLOIN_2v1573165 [Rhizophagus irregularis DAOM 181602=DAOM 197198]UZO20736.1 hypothetical protein OCT59_013154 [Rhizophagus irregularis]GBC31569.1 hypothetical protein GLOIN_2v1573165 [Rhizophagus irregularis DAOM 181602=DAOM 197198]|eukprot:XP_025181650.1 hypothetical protein GLOIN_2v1573165 [Rhizophagus irregularis DAOM 181602=DAOM 197198]
MSLNLFPRLSENLCSLLEYAEDYDVIIRVGGGSNNNSSNSGKNTCNRYIRQLEFQAHSLILRARSEYFRTALSSKWARKEGETFIFEKPNISPTVFEVILRYIYSGRIGLEKLGEGDIVKLLIAADELIFEELIYPLQEYLLQNKQKWIQDNILYVLNTVIERNACSRLRSHCLSIVCPEPQKYFDSKEFMSLDETTLVSLLSRDDFCMDEGKIWDYLINWGLKNTYGIKNKDASKWSIEEFCSLEKTLQRCIPLIRFWQLSLEDFNSKVRPYAEILPRNLKLKLLRHFSSTKSSNNNTNSNSGSASLNINTGLVTPGTSPTEVSPILSSNDLILSLHNITKKSASYSNSLTVSPPVSPSVTPFSPPVRTIDSTIITHQQAALIACWIDRKNVKDFTPLTSIPYIFRLLFRGSRDGFSAKTFHDKCDGRGATIVVVRVSGTKELIGGYNPIGWSSPRDVEWRGTRDSFIFSLSNSHSDSSNNVSTPKSKISRIKKDCVNEAIQLQDKLGPSFGFYELKIIDDAHEGSSSYASGGLKYEHSIRDKFNYFQVDDYEVFQVLKK